MNKIWRNNRGASLILVIGCVALLSVVGSMLLLVTSNNREMKALEQKIQDTFYQAESRSDEMLSALETEAEAVLQDAFSDMLIQYTALSDAERQTRIATYFKEKLEARLSGAGAVNDVMQNVLGAGASVTGVTINGAVSVEASADTQKTDIVKLTDVTFSYNDGKGNESTITTDITVQSAVPDVQAGLNATSLKSDYTDFALITNGDVKMPFGTGTQVAQIEGNLYTAGAVDISAETTLKLVGAEKALIKKDINVAEGKFVVDNTGKISGGRGVWANGINIMKDGTVEGSSNFYIADDLTLTKNGGRIVLGGTGAEYVGFNGNVSAEPSETKSAITINNAKNITIDFSNLKNLVLGGTSYIWEEGWGTGKSVMQGEAIGYKDMQVMYLVPGECLSSGRNPMPTSEYTADMTMNTVYDYGTGTFDFSEYLVTGNEYVTRNVRLDGGATLFTYLYLNFKNEEMAAKFFVDYTSSVLGADIKDRIHNMGTSEIKLAQNNYTVGAVMEYDGSSLTITPAGGSNAYRLQSVSTAKQRQEALFSTFRFTSSGSLPADWDVLEDGVLSANATDLITGTGWTKMTYGTSQFWTYKGDVTITSANMKGIILVDGKVTFQGSAVNVEGLVIATDGVEFQSGATLKANKSVVETLLQEPEVAKYFRADTTSEDSSFLSTEAVDVKFENWKRN